MSAFFDSPLLFFLSLTESHPPLIRLEFRQMLESMVSPSGLARIQLAIVIGALLYTILHIILYNAGVVAHVFFSADFGTLLLYTLVPTRIRSNGRMATIPSSSSSSSSSTTEGTNPTPTTSSGGNTSQWVKASILKSRFYILAALAGLWAIQPYQLTDVDHLGDNTPFDLLRDSRKSLSKLARRLLHQNQNLTDSQFRDLKRNADLTAWAMQGLAVGALALATLVALEALVIWKAREQQLQREQKGTLQEQQQRQHQQQQQID